MRTFMFPSASIIGILLPTVVFGAVTEGRCTIYQATEMEPRLRATFGKEARLLVPMDAPVLVPSELDMNSPKELRIALLRSGLVLKEDAPVLTVRAAVPSEAAAARPRLLDFNAITPASGDPEAIGSGGVVLFGLPIDPPYVVDVIAGSVAVNGVAVLPPPDPNVDPPQPTPANVAFSEGLNDAWSRYATDQTSVPRESARQNLISRIRALPGVRSAEWTDDDNVMVTKDDGTMESLGVEPDEAFGSGPTKEDASASLDLSAEILREGLRENRTVLCGTSYFLTVDEPPAPEFFRKVREILASHEPEALKIARIQAYTIRREAAADLLYRQNR